MKKKKGKWIVITGLDGSGKTTLKNSLSQYYGALSFKSPYHQFVRDSLKISGYGKIFTDVYTDIILFIADYRITNYKINEWRLKEPIIISQRGFMDHFIFNKAWGVDYNETNNLLKPDAFEKPTISIYLVADPKIAYDRIKDDPNQDKFETHTFMKSQYLETMAFYKLINKNKLLKKLFPEPRYLIDTTNLTPKETFDLVIKILSKHKI